MSRFVNRRDLLNSAAILAGATALCRASKATALTLEPMPPMSTAAFAYADRCGGDSAHSEIETRLRQALAADKSRSSISERCPICGCPITVTR